jgi:hypothetical protein
MVPASQAARCIHGEYMELPGLSLTRHQVQRLYALDEVTCEAVLAALVDLQFLSCTGDGRYVRRDAGGPPGARKSTSGCGCRAA